MKKKTNTDPYLPIYKAVETYVRSKGGTVIVAGGVEIHHDPFNHFRYKVAIQCTGRKPNFAADPKPESPLPRKAKKKGRK